MIKDKIKCDKCDWKLVDHVPSWHNKPCPKCKDSIIITDKDLALWKTIEEGISLGLFTRDLSKNGILITLDSSKLNQ
jgi:phage FluMu protein Com